MNYLTIDIIIHSLPWTLYVLVHRELDHHVHIDCQRDRNMQEVIVDAPCQHPSCKLSRNKWSLISEIRRCI